MEAASRQRGGRTKTLSPMKPAKTDDEDDSPKPAETSAAPSAGDSVDNEQRPGGADLNAWSRQSGG